MASLKDARKAVQEGQAAGWGQLIQLQDNKHKEGLGFSPTSGVSAGTFRSAGFVNAILVQVQCYYVGKRERGTFGDIKHSRQYR